MLWRFVVKCFMNQQCDRDNLRCYVGRWRRLLKCVMNFSIYKSISYDELTTVFYKPIHSLRFNEILDTILQFNEAYQQEK